MVDDDDCWVKVLRDVESVINNQLIRAVEICRRADENGPSKRLGLELGGR